MSEIKSDGTRPSTMREIAQQRASPLAGHRAAATALTWPIPPVAAVADLVQHVLSVAGNKPYLLILDERTTVIFSHTFGLYDVLERGCVRTCALARASGASRVATGTGPLGVVRK